MRRLIVLVAFLLPVNVLRRTALRLLGFSVARGAEVGINLVWGLDELDLAPGSRLGSLNLIRHVSRLEIGEAGFIGSHNIITAHPVYAQHFDEAGRVVLGAQAVITSRHSIDCSGGLFLGPFAWLVGHGTSVLSHSVDLRRVAQSATPVRLHPYAFVGSNSLLIGGAEVPERACLVAGSVLSKSLVDEGPGLYGGSPPRRIGDLDVAWFSRTTSDITDVYVPERDVTITNAFAPPRLRRRSSRR